MVFAMSSYLLCSLFLIFFIFDFFILFFVIFVYFFFFFSSRRRHTRCLSDWSSDVCSSDLRQANCQRLRLLAFGVGMIAGSSPGAMPLTRCRTTPSAAARPRSPLPTDRKSVV